MRKLLLVAMAVILTAPSFLSLTPETSAASSSTPFAPHEVKVLLVSPAHTYYGGGHYLVADLARYGFDVTQHVSNDALATNYVNDSVTSNLGQYDVVILHGILGFPPSQVSKDEIYHFTKFNGTLIVIGNALFTNETGYWYDFNSEPFQEIEQRLGVDFTGFLGAGGAWHNNGIFDLMNSSIKGLPLSIPYTIADPLSTNYQLSLTTEEASTIYTFTTSSPLSGRTANGVTYYRNSTGAVGIYLQGAYIYATNPSLTKMINYYGLLDIMKRSALLASLIAFSLGKDTDTIIKPQPLATIRLNNIGEYFPQTYSLNTSLSNFDLIIDNYNITPSISFTDFLTFTDYWNKDGREVLSQLKSEYRDWEYSSSLRKQSVASMTQVDIENLIQNIEGNYTALGMDLFSTVTPSGYSLEVLNALHSNNLMLIDLAKNSSTKWWNLEVNSNIVVHQGTSMVLNTAYENFTQIDPDISRAKDALHYEYYRYRDEWSLAVVNGFPSFMYDVRGFRWNEVGTYSLQTVYKNLTYEIPDIRFVPLSEAALYFGNKWARIEDSVRVNSNIEFNIDSSSVPEVVSIGKGMLWLRVALNETEKIKEVIVDGQPWYYFDESSIRVPASATHVKITVGSATTPRVVKASNIVNSTIWGLARFTVYMHAEQGLNVTLRLLIPETLFPGVPPANWTVYSSEAKWDYKFDGSSRLLSFWAISDDGSLTFKVGFDVVPPYLWSINHTSTDYDLNVTVTANATELQTSIRSVTLNYMYNNSGWVNVNMTLNDGLYAGDIPAFPWGTHVKYTVNASDTIGNWAITQITSYNVTDKKPPEIGVPNWTPQEPSVGQLVTVKVNVTEQQGASGIKKINLWYRRHGASWEQPVPMALENGLWSASFPALETDTVDFLIEAVDNAVNKATSRVYSYNVGGRSIINPVTLVLIGCAVAVSIGTVTLFVRRRRKLNKAPPMVSTQSLSQFAHRL